MAGRKKKTAAAAGGKVVEVEDPPTAEEDNEVDPQEEDSDGKPSPSSKGSASPSRDTEDEDEGEEEEGDDETTTSPKKSPPVYKHDFDYVISEVLQLPPQSPIIAVFAENHIFALEDFMDLRENEMEQLIYYEGRQQKYLSRGHAAKLRIFRKYVATRPTMDKLEPDFARRLTKDGFNSYRLSQWNTEEGPSTPFRTPAPNAPTAPNQNASPTNISVTRPKASAVETFRRGIKRDPSLFPTLRDERQHDKWHRSFENQAFSQGVAKVLNTSYIPLTLEDTELLEEMQIYMYAVLDKTVLTDKGQEIVRKYHDKRDARAVYVELLEHHRNSNKAKLNANTLLTYLTTTKLGSSTWRGNTENFIIHFLEQIRQYNALARSTTGATEMDDQMKKQLLQNAVSTVRELDAIQNNAAMQEALGLPAITFDKYRGLLSAAAQTYDRSHTTGARSRRQTYQHELEYDYYEPEPNYGSEPYDDYNTQYRAHQHESIQYQAHRHETTDGFGIDEPIDTIQAFATERNRNSVSMPRKRWEALDPESQQRWD